MTFDEFIDALRAGEAASIAAAASFSPVDRSTALLAAVEFENEAAALALLQAGASPRYQDAGTLQSPLLLAVAHRSQTLVAALLAAGAEVDVRDSTGMSPLLLAASRDEVDLVKQLIAVGADLDLRSHQNGRAPLAPAAIKSPAVCATLLEAGADLETTDHNDSSPLSGALLVNAYDCVELLVTRGAFVPEDARAKLPAAQKLLEAHTDAAEFERRAKVKPLVAERGIEALTELPGLLKWPRAARAMVVEALTAKLIGLSRARDQKTLAGFVLGWCTHAGALGFRRDFLSHAEATLVSSLLAVSRGEEALERALLEHAVPTWVPPSLAYDLAGLFARREERERAIYFTRIAIDSGARADTDFQADADFEVLREDEAFNAALEDPQFVLERGGPFDPDVNAASRATP